jgi:hypothetical protein
MYFTVPSAEVLHAHRERVFSWSYGHILIFGSIVATGAGLHVAATYIADDAHIGATATVLTVAVPVAVFVLALFALYTFLVHSVDPFHITLLAGSAAVLVLPVLLATMGAPMAVCLVVLMLAPLVTVIGYETPRPPARGHRSAAHPRRTARHQIDAVLAPGSFARIRIASAVSQAKPVVTAARWRRPPRSTRAAT